MRVRYGPGRAQFGELTFPDGPGPHPVCVVIHGGFWRRRYTLALMRDVSADLAARGVAAWNIEYRRGGACWPVTRDDVTAAVEHLAQVDGVDLDRVTAVGHSAGGHLAAWLAGTNAQRRVRLRAACAQAGVVDLEAALRNGSCAPNVRRLLGLVKTAPSPFYQGADRGPEPRSSAESEAVKTARSRILRGADPARLPLDVPVLCVHGADDDVVPVSVSEAFVAAQPTAALRVFGGQDHMGHIDPRNPMWQAAAEWLTAA